MKYLETVIHLIILRTAAYLEQTGHQDSFEKFPSLGRLSGRLSEEDVSKWAKEENPGAKRYRELLCLIGDDAEPAHVMESVLDLSLAVLYVPEFAAYLQYHTSSPVTLHLAYELEGIYFPDAADVRRKLDGLQLITYIDRRKYPIQYAEIQMDDRVLSYLMGDDEPVAALSLFCHLFKYSSILHPLYVHEELAGRALTCLQSKHEIVQFAGAGGKKFLAKHTAVLMKRNFLFVNMEGFGSFGGTNFEMLKMSVLREALFLNAGLCIYGITRERLEQYQFNETVLVEQFVRPAIAKRIPLIICSEDEIELSDGGELPLAVIELPLPGFHEREQVWSGFAGQYHLEIDSTNFAARYKLTASEIAEAVSIWQKRNGNAQKDVGSFPRICYRIACKGIKDTMGKIIYPEVTMEDLKVTSGIRDMLGQIIASVNGSYQIFEEWNLKRFYPYGRAVTVLLAGPPGTGKTMSAHVIANALGIPLYQVNLSNIVDKYIGETEKHLEQVFTFAEKANMVLFFDEADSLFGKRSEVTDAKDKYANTEVSYILQRIEQFDGIAILATNFQNNIDSAFLRRIKYVVRFLPPDAGIRLRIWEGCLPAELPVDDLDLPYLARQFEFPGGTIKNVILNACAIALYEEENLNMLHILKAIQNEYIKMERTVNSSTWGEYAFLLA